MTLFLTYLLACAAAGATGVLFQPGDWYRGLEKPDWTPPDWAFPVAWTTLYLLMAFAAVRLSDEPGNAFAMALWSAQIALNTLWTPVFFGAHRMGLGLVVLSVLWLVVMVLVVTALGLDLLAGLMLLAYLGWLSVAWALNFTIWRLNRA